MATAMINENQFIRQTGLINPTHLTMPICIVGAGGIGSWTTLALLKMGCQDITIMDHDSVEEHNAGAQIYTSVDEGKPKVEALQDKCFIMTDIQPKIEAVEWLPTVDLSHFGFIISAVDNMRVRRELFTEMKKLPEKIFIDGRMSGNQIQIYTVKMSDPTAIAEYEKTIYPTEEIDPEKCSERAVVYNTFVMAGLMADIVAHLANSEDVPFELIVDLKNFAMMN